MSRAAQSAPREHAAPRRVSAPHDHHEREAERAAETVAHGGSVAGWSFSAVPASAPQVQRQEAAPKEKSEDEKKKEALKKAGEAALETPQGKALKEKVLQDPLVKSVTDAVTSTPGLIAGGAVLAGGVVALGAAGKELPIQPPEIPLEKVSPKLAGISAKIAYEGPVNAPTFVGLTITVKEQGKEGKTSKPDPIAADIARLRAQEEMFKRGRTYAPGSKEAEEERLLDQAVTDFVLRRSALPGFTIPLVAPKAPKKEEEQKPAQPAPASPSAAPPAHVHVDGALSSPGRPLDPAARRAMESRFAHDFSRVRIHDDARAAATARSIDAAAFTVGDDIAFAPGRYDPNGPEGQRLLAHELAHVVQQAPGDRGRDRSAVPEAPGRPLDAELRARFQPLLGVDLRSVRIHTGDDAAAAARGRGARAYTTGSHLVFGPGHYRPETPVGRWLLAHELAHVAQTQEGPGADGRSAVEKDATTAASALLRGERHRVRARRAPDAVHLFGEPDHVPDLTFVSTSGTPGFLNQAVQYHRTWGLAPRRFNSMQHLLQLLAADTGSIARLRIVSHADFNNIFSPMFDGGAPGITEEELAAVGAGDVAALQRVRGRTIRDAVLAGRILDAARAAGPAALQPFGLDTPGSTPTGVTEQLVAASIDLLAIRTATGEIPAAQRATLEAAITAELAGLRVQVQQPAPAGAGVTATQAQALQDAITGVTGFTFTLGAQPAGFIGAVQTTTAGLGAGFRSNLDAVRARLSTSSWIDIRGCRVGQRPSYLAAVADFFGRSGSRPGVSGPDWFQSYPTLGFQTVLEADIAARARNRDVQTALDHWAYVTGIRARRIWWLNFYLSILRDDLRRRELERPSILPAPPGLSGGLRLQLDPLLVPFEPAPTPLPELAGPTLTLPPRTTPGLSPGTLPNPLVPMAERELARYGGPDGELRYYLDADLPLPVQAAANVQNIFLLIRAGREREAVDAWLGSQWEPAAPGLAALQAGDWRRGELRQVEAVSDVNEADQTIAMFVSPDPRYAEHIRTT